MGAYSVPEEIRKLKPKGTIVKLISGNYYVYSHSQHKDPVTGKWKTDPGKILGKIIPGVGYIPNEDSCRNKGITCFDYGQYLMSCFLSGKDYELLKEFFTAEESMQLFSLSTIVTVEGYKGITVAEDYFERSLIAHDYPDLDFSYKRLSRLLELIGRQDTARKFQQKCLAEGGTELAIDGHVIATSSENNDLASPGYKAKTLKSNQMNLMVALDVESSSPVATKVYPGYMLDKSDFADFIEHCGSVKGKIILIDKGFYSEDNMLLIENEGAFYVIPLCGNHSAYRTAIKDVESLGGGDKLQDYFFYKRGNKTDLVKYKIYDVNGRRVIYYKNISEAEKLSKKYLAEIKNGSKGYTQEKYDQIVDSFGAFVLITNLTTEGAASIYSRYKNRWSIENYYDKLKNVTCFKELNIDDWAVTQGLAFVMLLSGRMDARISEAAKKVKMSKKKFLSLASYLKLTDVDGRKMIHNLKDKHFKVFETLGLSMDTNVRCLG